MNLPSGHQTIMPYLILKGASRFIDFCKKVFDAKDSNQQVYEMTGLLCMLKLYSTEAPLW